MHRSIFRLAIVGFSTCLTLPLLAQQLISAKSGLIHYTEGDVKIGSSPASPNNGVFQSLAVGKELSTGEGRAEMLLGPGQFIRLNENTTVRMVSNKLDATRLDVVHGSVLVELVDVSKNAPVTLGFGDNTIELRKAGLYRIDASEARVRVYDGEASIQGNGQTLTAKKGKEVVMGAVLAENSFDSSTGDEFSRWAQRRAGYVATANVSSARDAFGSSANGWAYNSWYGMYTYVPGRRAFMSPFGFVYFSPDMAYNNLFWDYLGGGYGFYGLGYGFGYFPGYGYGGYGYNPYGYGGGYYGGGGIVAPVTPPSKGNGGSTYPVVNRGAAFGPRGTNTTGFNNGGNHTAGPVMVRGGAGYGGSYGGGAHPGGGYSNGSVGGHSGGGSGGYSGGGGHSVGAASSGGGGGAHSVGGMSGGGSASSGGAAASSGASAGGRAK